ncbi:MAG: MATE family efflux transporter, partial [Lachnospiraceae bacterium]|nr:MATE family efflux transporter [Lachnospiraceae bacterium]
MGVMPVSRLLIGMSLPIMTSMLIQALYNIVDSIFVARVSENALTAVSLAFPMQAMMMALGIGTAIGINAVLSKALGEKDFDKVNRAANNGIFMTVIVFLVFLVVGLFAVDGFYRSQTGNAEIIAYGKDYLIVICTCSFGVFAQITLEKLLQSTGRTVYSMITQMTGAIINIILDPIMIFGYFGCPAMGVKG